MTPHSRQGMSDEDASGTAVHLRHQLLCAAAIATRCTTGETLLVLGAPAASAWRRSSSAKALGARVIACASSAEKLALCKEHGADRRDRLRPRGSQRADQGAHRTVTASTSSTTRSAAATPRGAALDRLGGRFLVVGFASGEIPKIPLNLALLKGCPIVGVFWGDFMRREAALFSESIRNICQWHADWQAQAAHLRGPAASARLPKRCRRWRRGR